MNQHITEEALAIVPAQPLQPQSVADATQCPFVLVIDPEMRAKLREALFKLIDCHDRELARYVAEDRLSLESYKEYVELFCRSLKECMESREGIAYLLEACGFDVPSEQVNTNPEWRWKN